MSPSILDKVIASQETKEISQIPWQELYRDVVNPLLEKERGMLTMRHGLDGQGEKTLEEIGKVFQLTRERVRQIIKLALKKVSQALSKSDAFAKLKQVIVVEIERLAGMVPLEKMSHILAGDQQQHSLLNFVFFGIGIPGIDRIEAGETLKESLKLVHTSVERFESLLCWIESEVGGVGGMTEDDLFCRAEACDEFHYIVSLALNPELSRDVLRNVLDLSARLERNTLGVWGMKTDSLVIPRRVSDKIYLVLKHNGEPMHFRDITKSINDMKFDDKKAYLPTIHNELILDKRFVLVGRGMYALVEWGYVRGVVADVIENILREEGPLTRLEVEEEVLKQRMVKTGTIYLSLTNKKRFAKDKATGRYSVVEKFEADVSSSPVDQAGAPAA